MRLQILVGGKNRKTTCEWIPLELHSHTHVSFVQFTKTEFNKPSPRNFRMKLLQFFLEPGLAPFHFKETEIQVQQIKRGGSVGEF